MADAQALLQPGEPGLAAVESDDLPVDDEVAGLLGGQGLGDLGVGAGVLLVVAGHQPDPPAGSERQASLAVELALEHPPRVGEPVLGERGQLRVEPAGLIRPGGRCCGSHGVSGGYGWPGQAGRQGTARPGDERFAVPGWHWQPGINLEDSLLLTRAAGSDDTGRPGRLAAMAVSVVRVDPPTLEKTWARKPKFAVNGSR
jgi:hypothetical protein